MNNNRYDSLIKRYADQYGLDWRLLKMQIMVESHGNPRQVSASGAKGLMQITDQVWANFGSGSIFDPADNIKAGCRYLRWLYDKFAEIPDKEERYKFVLAAYNTGYGNINQVLKLAREAEGYPGSFFRWRFARQFLPQVTGQKASETINYVTKVMNGRYL